MSQKEKYQQIKREARACIIALVLIIAFWAIAGLGVSKLGITVFHTPLWAITGCIGTWIFSVVLIWWIIKKVFKDFDLDEESEKKHEE